MSYIKNLALETRTCGQADEDARLDAEDYAMASLSRPAPRGSAIPDWRPYEPVAPLSEAALEDVVEAAAMLHDATHGGALMSPLARQSTITCACGAPAVLYVHGKDILDDVCQPCYERFYRDNEADSRAWEANPLPACPFCSDTHAPGKCPVVAALTGAPLIAGLRAQIAELETRLAEYRSVNALATDALERYAARFGPLS